MKPQRAENFAISRLEDIADETRPYVVKRSIESCTVAAVGGEWRDQLSRRGHGFAGDERNVLIALRSAPELAGLVRYNEFSLDVEVTRAPPWRKCLPRTAWIDADDTAIAIWLQQHDIQVRGRPVVADTVLLAARDNSFHPVRNYLTSVKWDGEERLKNWLRCFLSATDQKDDYLRAIGTRFLVSAVARIFQPGCQVDHILVLEGSQGVGKTSAARALAVCPEWFAGNLPDIHNKDAALQLCGRWVVEIDELKAIRHSQVEAIKSFLSETVDTFRPPYARRTGQFPRQCVFVATTNESQYLQDRTGNRRYWPVRCGKIDVEALVTIRDQLWAEATILYRNGTAWHLTDVEATLASNEQQERVRVTELETDVGRYLDRLLNMGVRDTSVRDVLIHGLHLDPDHSSYTEVARRNGSAVADAMEQAGWKKVGRQGQQRHTIYRFEKSAG